MGLHEYAEAKRLMQHYPDWMHFVGPGDPDAIRLAEIALGLRFPPSYRQFLLDYALGFFGAKSFSGVKDANFEVGSSSNTVWETLSCRRDYNLPTNLVYIQNGILDEDFFLQINGEGESPVVSYNVGLGLDPNQTPVVIAPDFGTFFLDTIKEQIRRRT